MTEPYTPQINPGVEQPFDSPTSRATAPLRPPAVRIADIAVDEFSVYTPAGTLARRRTYWFLGGATPVSESCPGWAQVLAIIGIPCTGFLSLLLLLIKEPDSWSSPLRVTDGRIAYHTTVYSRSRYEYDKICNVVNWAQSAMNAPIPDQSALPSGPG